MNNYKFTDYLDFLYGDKLSCHPNQIKEINDLIDVGIVFDLDNDSWIVVHEDYCLDTNLTNCNATLIKVVGDKSPYQLVVTKTNLKRFKMPC